MGNVIDRVQRAAEEGFNSLLDLFGEEVTPYNASRNGNTMYALVDKPLQIIDNGANVIDRLDITFQFLKDDLSITGLTGIHWDSRDWYLSNSLSLNEDNNLNIYTCIGRYVY